jgi:hypothetical protein
LPTGSSIFGGQQAFILFTVLLIVFCCAAILRLVFLPSHREYRPFLGVLIFWVFLNFLTLTVDISSRLYFRAYIITTPILWILYLLVARNLYQKIFSRYPGIATAGRWVLYMAGTAVAAVAVYSLFFSHGPLWQGRTLITLGFLDRCLLCGFAFFLLLLVSVISRYPITIQRNIAIHCLVFSSILFFQAVLLVADQWTAFRNTMALNTLSAALSSAFVFAWAWRLNQEGDISTVRIRHGLDPALEGRLLGQLDTLNGILLRAARK